MRSLMALVLVVGLVGCANPPTLGVASSGDQRGPRLRVLNLPPEAGAGIFHCRGPGAGSQYNGLPKCSEIPVIVLDGGRGCASLLPYNQLKIHVGSNKEEADVTWVLVADDGYKFDAALGIKIDDPASTYEMVGIVNGSQGRKYRWNVKTNAVTAESGHQALVLPPSGPPCTPIDPKIINVE